MKNYVLIVKGEPEIAERAILRHGIVVCKWSAVTRNEVIVRVHAEPERISQWFTEIMDWPFCAGTLLHYREV